MSHVPPWAGFIGKAAAGAVALAVLGAGPASASSMSPGASGGPVSTGQPAAAARPDAAARPGSTAHRHPIRVGSVTIPPCQASRLAWCTRINVPLDYRDPAAG